MERKIKKLTVDHLIKLWDIVTRDIPLWIEDDFLKVCCKDRSFTKKSLTSVIIFYNEV